MLVHSGAKQVMFVRPDDKRVISMDSAGGSPMEAMQGMMQMTVIDTSSRVEALGPGETVMGFSTRKYRVQRAYTMRMTMMGRPIDIRNESVARLHVSNDIGALDRGFDAFARSFANATGNSAGGPDAMRVISALNRGVPKGFVVLQEEETRSTTAGVTTVTRSTWQVTDFGRGGVRESELSVPECCARDDMRSMMRREGSGAARRPAIARP